MDKKIAYTNNALARIIARGLTIGAVEQAILKPDKVVASRGDRYKATGNTDVGRISVLYTEKEGKVTVLTAYPGE